MSGHARRQHIIVGDREGVRSGGLYSIGVLAFLVGGVAAAIVLTVFGLGQRGTSIALRVTARWSFLFFWLAYVGRATPVLFGPRFSRLARHGRDFGLAFASAQLVHVGLVLWLYYLDPNANGGMVFFWVESPARISSL